MSLGRCELDLVPGRGLRLRGDARITWDVAGVTVPVQVDRWQVMLAPRVVTRAESQVLAFDPHVEILDLKHVPTFLCGKITAAIGDGIRANEGKLGRALAKRIALPAKLGSGALALVSTSANVDVTEEALTLSVELEPRVESPAITVAA